MAIELNYLIVGTISLGIVAELLSFFVTKRPLQLFLACVGILQIFSNMVIIAAFANESVIVGLWWLFVLLVCIFRLINLFRVFIRRMHKKYLASSGLRSAASLLAIQLILCIFFYCVDLANSSWQSWAAIANFIVVAVLFVSLMRTLVKIKPQNQSHHYADAQLPAVSVLVPARNETDDLQQCLRSLLASDYPKLEIVVYDDCSQVKTSDIIKKFAHQGVRFIKGVEPRSSWLAKNLAYQKLYEEATGEIVMYCGVDTRFSVHSIRSIVATMLYRKKSMISLMPIRQYGAANSAIIQPMRYWWELVPPRRLFNRPPVLSTCWLIRRNTLKDLGGFASLSRSIIPEQFLARECTSSDRGYSFLKATKFLDVQTVKSLPDQRETALRVRYPLLKRAPENVFMLLLAEYLVFVLPFVIAISSVNSGQMFAAWVSFASMALLTAMHVVVVAASSPGHTAFALVNLPIVLIVEVWVIVYSMFKYEFGSVIWKERNVCIPAMHVYPKLPKVG